MDFQDQPTTKSIPWKPVALAAASLVVVIVLVFVVVRWVKKDAQMKALDEVVQEEVVSSVDDCETAQDPESCRQGEITDLATKYQSVETCELLETDEARDNCYWAVAREVSDASYCAAISVEEDAQRCSDGIEARTAVREDPLSVVNCDERAPELCDDLKLSAQAEATLDELLCREIVSDDIRENCKETVSDQLTLVQGQEEADDDEDGLTTVQEATYGTDPDNSDTDGDGYLDGAEVSAGYNPLGSGRL